MRYLPAVYMYIVGTGNGRDLKHFLIGQSFRERLKPHVPSTRKIRHMDGLLRRPEYRVADLHLRLQYKLPRGELIGEHVCSHCPAYIVQPCAVLESPALELTKIFIVIVCTTGMIGCTAVACFVSPGRLWNLEAGVRS